MDHGKITKSMSTLIITLNGTTGVVDVLVICRELSVDLNTMKLDGTCNIQKINIRDFIVSVSFIRVCLSNYLDRPLP